MVRRSSAASRGDGRRSATVDRTVPPHKETLFSMATDPEAQGWSVSRRASRAGRATTTVGDYRAALVAAAGRADAERALPRDRAAPERAVPRRQAGADSSAGRSSCSSSSAAVPEGGLAAGLEAIVVESAARAAVRLQRRGARSRPAARWSPSTSAPTRSGHEREPGLRRRVRPPLPRVAKPIPGIEFEYRIAAHATCPTVTLDEVVEGRAKSSSPTTTASSSPSRRRRRMSPRPTVDSCSGRDRARRQRARSSRGADATAGAELVEEAARRGKVTSTPRRFRRWA